MDHIDRQGGRFVCAMPHNRPKDAEFREWIHPHESNWEPVRDESNPRRHHGP